MMNNIDEEMLEMLCEKALLPVYCPRCGTWLINLLPEHKIGYMRITCPNGHRTEFPKGIHPDGIEVVFA